LSLNESENKLVELNLEEEEEKFEEEYKTEFQKQREEFHAKFTSRLTLYLNEIKTKKRFVEKADCANIMFNYKPELKTMKMSTTNQCNICYEDIKSINCVTPCGHSFCFGCISKSLSINNTCPCCRTEIAEKIEKDDDSEYLFTTLLLVGFTQLLVILKLLYG
jgi:Ring finger domain